MSRSERLEPLSPRATASLPTVPWWKPRDHRRAIDGWLELIDPMLSIDEIRAEVTERFDETPDTTSIWLQANRSWTGHQAGQHVTLRVEHDGVRRIRAFSISSAPDRSRRLRLTVKRQPGGLVSNAICDRLSVGDVVTLSEPVGGFGRAAARHDKLMMISAGSGITPMMSLLIELQRSAPDTSVVLVHVCRSAQDRIFAEALLALAAEWPALELHWHYTAKQGRPSPADLLANVPDIGERHSLLCGPPTFMEEVRRHFASIRQLYRLECEYFGAPVTAPQADAAHYAVHLSGRERSFQAAAGVSLLSQAESAGEHPPYGCRIGICQNCKCRKASGSVVNLLTGRRSSEPGEWIQLCINAAASDVVLDL